jgi:hypothetical protein
VVLASREEARNVTHALVEAIERARHR